MSINVVDSIAKTLKLDVRRGNMFTGPRLRSYWITWASAVRNAGPFKRIIECRIEGATYRVTIEQVND